VLKKPLLRKISEYLQQNHLGFHTPGHQQGKGSEKSFLQLLQQSFLKMDLTELPGLDNLKNPCGCLRESQSLAANLFGAIETFYLVNGSTVGLQAALLALNSPGGKVIIPRHAHLSVLNGLVLSGGSPLIVPVHLEKTWGIPWGVSPEKLTFWLEKENVIDLVLTVQPTYQGIGFNAGAINKLIKEKGVLHVVDEAHGAHLFFQEHLPLSLQKEHADLVVQSTHKTLSALTQASMLHVNNEQLIAPVRAALNILQTTSPSYLLLASLDSVQSQMMLEGPSLVDKVLELADLLREGIRKIPGYRVFPEEKLPPGWHYDPTKVLVSAASLGLTGWELARLLREKQGIVVEMCDYFSVLFLVTLGHTYEDIKRVRSALCEIGQEEREKPLSAWAYPACIYEYPLHLVLTPREVYYNRKEVKKIAEVEGRICGEALTVYPPGIPCLWPGQLIEKEHVEYLQWGLCNNLEVQGVSENGEMLVVQEK
jgi:arginine decarboxylase